MLLYIVAWQYYVFVAIFGYRLSGVGRGYHRRVFHRHGYIYPVCLLVFVVSVFVFC